MIVDIGPQKSLQDLYIARLGECFDPETSLFTKQIRHGEWAPTRDTESVTSSAICLIGLGRAGISVRDMVGDAALTCKSIARRIKEERYLGGLGLLLWANATVRGISLTTLLAEAGSDEGTLADAIPVLTTMEVAWMLSGLLHTDDARLQSARAIARRELQSRLVERTLVFRHASAKAPWAHFVRMHVANFADQIYPVQAFAFAAKARGDHAALDLADRVAARLISSQGAMGQWWWHHHAGTGQIIEKYPVYSVHQHSMAPMAFICLSSAGGKHHVAHERGRNWLHHNELGVDMADSTSGIVWRSIERDVSSVRRSARQLKILSGKPIEDADSPMLRLNREMRPYEWGWLLYVSALEANASSSSHII